MLRNRSFEDSVLPEGYIQQEDGIHVKTVSGWLDEFCNGEGLCRWVKGNNIPETEIPAWYTHNAKMELELTDTLNEHRDAALRMQFEKDGSLTNTGYCGISVKAGESYSLYLFAKAKEEIGLDVAIEYQGKVLGFTTSVNFFVVSRGVTLSLTKSASIGCLYPYIRFVRTPRLDTV